MNKKYRKAIIAGNWKMNMLASEIKPYFEELRTLVPKHRGCDVVICAPFPLLPALHRSAKDWKVGVGAQDVSAHASGAYTGEVSTAQLRDINVGYTIIGHSERRAYHGETDAIVSAKVTAALEAKLTPIICVGESLEQREAGLTMELISYQLKAALSGVAPEKLRRCVIAYEPVWAIGTGVTATSEQAQEVCSHIRSDIRSLYGARVARAVSILYGGSMNAANAAELLAMPDIDGGLIGGAALKPNDFSRIILAATAEA